MKYHSQEYNSGSEPVFPVTLARNVRDIAYFAEPIAALILSYFYGILYLGIIDIGFLCK